MQVMKMKTTLLMALGMAFGRGPSRLLSANDAGVDTEDATETPPAEEAAGTDDEPALTAALREALGMAEATPGQLLAEVARLRAAANGEGNGSGDQTMAEDAAAVTSANARAATAESALETAQTAEANRLIQIGLETGRFALAQRPHWVGQFAEHHETAANALVKIKPGAAIALAANAGGPGLERARTVTVPETPAERIQTFNAAVSDRQKKYGGSWNKAYQDCLADPSLRGLVAAMNPDKG